jgi:NADH-quinone oxidoreductase subunit F
MPRKGAGMQKYILCNSDESEPGTCKDRDILRLQPACGDRGHGHRLLRHRFPSATTTCAASSITSRSSIEQALKEAYKHGWLGKNMLGSGIDIDIHNALGAGAYICGEETALMESLEGKKGQPRFKPPFPANFGLYGKPTTINNTETYASVPAIVRNGAEWFLNLGKPNNGGPKIFSVSGHVAKPGNYEIRSARRSPTAGDGRRHARRSQAQGGDSGRLLDAGAAGRDDDGPDHGLRRIQKAGSGLGSGAVIVMDETTCMVRACQRISRFYFKESCGQCTPCREGTGWMYRMLTRIVEARRRWTICRC